MLVGSFTSCLDFARGRSYQIFALVKFSFSSVIYTASGVSTCPFSFARVPLNSPRFRMALGLKLTLATYWNTSFGGTLLMLDFARRWVDGE